MAVERQSYVSINRVSEYTMECPYCGQVVAEFGEDGIDVDFCDHVYQTFASTGGWDSPDSPVDLDMLDTLGINYDTDSVDYGYQHWIVLYVKVPYIAETILALCERERNEMEESMADWKSRVGDYVIALDDGTGDKSIRCPYCNATNYEITLVDGEWKLSPAEHQCEHVFMLSERDDIKYGASRAPIIQLWKAIRTGYTVRRYFVEGEEIPITMVWVSNPQKAKPVQDVEW